MLNRGTLARLSTMLAAEDVRRIEDNARVAEGIERRWVARFEKFFGDLAAEILRRLEREGELWTPDDLEDQIGALLLEHELNTITAASLTVVPADYVRAAKGSPQRWPSSLARIRTLWDTYRHTRKLPGRTSKQARKIKALYIKAVQRAWQKHGDEFIQGDRVAGKHPKSVKPVNRVSDNGRAIVWNPDAFSRAGATEAIRQAARVPLARAKTIVETETTRYYNDTRREVYDKVETVVAYLFVAVRDAATTKWCRSRQGVVFFKGTDLLRKNAPPCHYNCRSELLPLSRLNPAHRKLLENESLWAENRVLVPLLPEWNSDKAA